MPSRWRSSSSASRRSIRPDSRRSVPRFSRSCCRSTVSRSRATPSRRIARPSSRASPEQAAASRSASPAISTSCRWARTRGGFPFAGIVHEGRLYGRGASDMKAGVAAFIAAACNVRADEPRFHRGLTLVITAGEETGCEGAFHVGREQVLGPAELLIVAEPTSNAPIFAHKGSLRVIVTARGRTAHSSMPEEGQNAVARAAAWIHALGTHDFGVRHPLLGTTTACVTTFRGGENINSVPDWAEFSVDIRTLPEQDHGRLLNALRTLFGPDAEIRVVTSFPGFSTAVEDPAAAPLLALLHERTGLAAEPAGAPYFTDASALVPAFDNVATVVIGPGEAAQCHKTDEHCRVDRIEEAQALYTDLIRRLCIDEAGG
ncbi:M20 family metallopeptidase [Methylobacterium tardum]|uniref:M20 family metallopeptidase n=1 Tax=Methylobacterium tardum TaxID=374432 RepID=UPI003611355F